MRENMEGRNMFAINKEDYQRALVEVLEVIKFLPKDEQNAIPRDVLDKMQKAKSKDYCFSLDRTKKFNLQISQISKAILANLFKDYWATDMEKEVIKAKENKNRRELEEYKKKLYPTDNIFKKKSN